MEASYITSNLIGIIVLIVIFLCVYETFRKNLKEDTMFNNKKEYLEDGTVAIPASVVADYMKKSKKKVSKRKK